MESGWNVWVWLVGVLSRRWVWVESMGVVSGCGCKEVYLFLQQHPYFLLIKKNVFPSCSSTFL